MDKVTIKLDRADLNFIRSCLAFISNTENAREGTPTKTSIAVDEIYRDIGRQSREFLFGNGEPVNIPRPLEERFDELVTIVGYIATQSIQYKSARENALAKLENLRVHNVSSKDTV